jgi:tetratricopeptide (TPR) repeat protein
MSRPPERPPPRPRRGLVLAVAFVALAGLESPAPADDRPAKGARPSAESLAEEFRAAFAANDEAKQRALIAALPVHPFVVVDALLAAGDVPAATAFASANPPERRDGLSAYVERRKGVPDEAEVRVAVKSAAGFLAQRNAASALLVLDAARPTSGGVLAVRHADLRARALFDLGRESEAGDAYEDAATAARDAGWDDFARPAQQNAAGIANRLRNYGVAERRLAVLEALQEPVDPQGAAKTAADRGSIAHLTGHPEDALRFYERAASRLDATGARDESVQVRAYGVEVLRDTGRYSDALRLEQQIRRLLESGGASRLQDADSLARLATIELELADFPRALGTVNKALSIYAEIGAPAETRAAALGTLGIAQEALGRHAEAKASFDEAQHAFEATKDAAQIATALHDLAWWTTRDGKPEVARAMFLAALKTSEDLRDDWGRVTVLLDFGEAEVARGKPDEARARYEDALRLAQELQSPRHIVAALQGLAEIHRRAGRSKEAVDAALQAIAWLGHASRALPLLGSAKGRPILAPVFESGAQAALALNDPERLCLFLEAGRAGELLEALGGRDVLVGAGIPEALDARRAAASEKAGKAYGEYLRARAKGVVEDVRARWSEYEAARAAEDDAIRVIGLEQTRVSKAYLPRPEGAKELCRILGGDEALLLYSVTAETPLVLVLTHDGARPVPLAGHDRLDPAILRLRAQDSDEPALEDAKDLRALAADVLNLPVRIKTVIVCPDRATSHVPFALLFPGRDVCEVPSGTVYRHLREGEDLRGRGVLAVGDPDYSVIPGGSKWRRLDKSAEEIAAIGDVVLRGREATIPGFLAAVAKRDRWHAIHLACHGEIDRLDPRRSSLVLTPVPDVSDGYLSTYQVFRTRLETDAAFLSACETTGGADVPGEGVVGLARAFMAAGAPRVVVSLWSVDDAATAALMKAVHERWKGGTSLATALRLAQESIAAQPKWKHPAYWAGWTLWGLPKD